MIATNLICDTIVQWLTENEPSEPQWSPEMWETFKLVCHVHGVASLLHETLRGSAWISDSLRDWLADQRALNRQRIALMQRELTQVLDLFAANNLPVMPLKGSILAAEFYKDPALRPMADLDLLIKPADQDNAEMLLDSLNYERTLVHWKHIELCKADNHQVVSKLCEHPDNPRKVELHLYCRESFGGPEVDLTETMWANSAKGILLGRPAILPRPEALWLHSLVHCTYHLWQGRGRLISLVDLAKLSPHVRGEHPLLTTIDARYTYPGLAMLKKYFPPAVDDSLLAAQWERVSPGFRAWTASLDLLNTSYLDARPSQPYFLKALKFAEGRPQEVRQAIRFSFLPKPDEIALDHPKLARSRVPWIAYLLLPLDWARRILAPHVSKVKL